MNGYMFISKAMNLITAHINSVKYMANDNKSVNELDKIMFILTRIRFTL